MSKNEIIKIGDGIYQIKYYWLGIANVYMFLVIGGERALLIDTGYATTDVMNYVRRVTDKPVIPVNTHGHFDHIGGNGVFQEVYLSEKDWKTARDHSDREYLQRMLQHKKDISRIFRMMAKLPAVKKELEESTDIGQCKYLPLPAESYFELGSRKVLFLETPGHTQGSICLFDEKTGSLFPGDMLCERGVLLGLDHSTSVEEYRQSVERIEKFYKEHSGKRIFPSHHELPVSENIFLRYRELCDKIISGEVKGRYIDDGISQGLCAKGNDLQIIYRRILRKEYKGLT